MKLHWLISFLLLLVYSSCSNQTKLNNNNNNHENKKTLDYPFEIKFGSIGKGSNLPPLIFEINQDSVRISARDKDITTRINHFAIETKMTEFENLISMLDQNDLTGDKHYFVPQVRDGGYMQFSSKLGIKKFSNTFSNSVDKLRIKPDTIGLNKFENISTYAKSLLKELNK